MTRPVVIFGTGEIAEVADYYFRDDGGREIAAFTVDGDHLRETTICGKPVIAFETIADACPPDRHDCFVAIGYSRINALRQAKCEAAAAKGYALASYVSTRAFVATNVVIGRNAFILENNVVQPFVKIGDGVTLWSGNHIGHHVRIGDYAFISSHVVLSGGVEVGSRSFLGVNTTVNDHISIGARCVIGSSSLIAKSLADESVVSAEPSRISPVPSRRLKGF